MSTRTNFLENAWLNHVTGKTAYAMPSGLYLALFTVAPGEEGGGTEVTGGGYARKLVPWGAVSNGVVANNDTILFENMPGVTVVATGLYPALTGGNLLYYRTFTAQEVQAGQAALFYAGSVSITAD